MAIYFFFHVNTNYIRELIYFIINFYSIHTHIFTIVKIFSYGHPLGIKFFYISLPFIFMF